MSPGCSYEIGTSCITEVPWDCIESVKLWRSRKLTRFLCMSQLYSFRMFSTDVANNWYAECICKTIQRTYSSISGLYIPTIRSCPQGRHISTWTEQMYEWMNVQFPRIGWTCVYVTSLLYHIPKQKMSCTWAVSIQRKNARITCLKTFSWKRSSFTPPMEQVSSLDRH